MIVILSLWFLAQKDIDSDILAQSPSEYDYRRALDSTSLKYKEHFYWNDILILAEKIWKNESAELYEKALLEAFKTLDEVCFYRLTCVYFWIDLEFFKF